MTGATDDYPTTPATDEPGVPVPDERTREAEERDAAAGHAPDRMPTADEEEAAPTSVDPEVAEHYSDMARKGAATKGEGRID